MAADIAIAAQARVDRRRQLLGARQRRHRVSNGRLRVRLVLMSLLTVVPAFIVIVSTQAVERGRIHRSSTEQIERLTRIVAAQQAAVLDEARRFLLTLARYPTLQTTEADCQRLLGRILPDHPGYKNIWLVHRDGRPFCAAVPGSIRSVASGGSWLTRALSTRLSAIGDDHAGIRSSSPDVVLAQPLFGSSGEIEKVLGVTIDPDSLSGVAAHSALPAGASLTLIDEDQGVLARYPDEKDSLSTRFTRVPPDAGATGESQIQVVDLPDAGLSTRLSVSMNVPTSVASQETGQLVKRQWEILALVVFATMGVAFIGGEWFVVRPVNELSQVAHHLANGDLTARARLPGGAPGLSELATAVNSMAMSLEARQREREEAEERLRASTDQLRHAQKMEAVGRLAGGIAHDFNNMLTAILGYSELLMSQLGSDKPMSADLKEISGAAKRAAALTRQLLAFSRKQSFVLSPLNLSRLVKGLEPMLRRVIGEHISITTDLAADVGMVMADAVQVEHALINLAVNARDAMPKGGPLTITTCNAELDAAYEASHPGAKAGSYVMVSVRDAGMGMTPEVQARLFEPFFTTKAPGRGTGLGLSAVYGTVKQLGGYIAIESELGRGSVFSIYLPKSAATIEPPAEPRRVGSAPVGTETILLVEDEDSVRQFAATVLRRYGYSVLDTASAETAIALLEGDSAGTPIHGLLTDVVLPGMDGRELAARVMRSRPSVRVLFMSGYAGQLVATEWLADPDTLLLEKPFTADMLLRQIHTLLSRAQQI